MAKNKVSGIVEEATGKAHELEGDVGIPIRPRTAMAMFCWTG